MNGTICKSVMENCQNPYDSYGEICVGCNCCGRFGEDTVWQARYNLAVERLQDNILKLQDGYFRSNLQQKNICTNISYWSKKLQEALTHLDFEPRKEQPMKEIKLKPFVEDEIYPLTIIADRYSGTYSGGSYTAWNLAYDVIPDGVEFDGDDALDFWESNSIPYGKGRTVSEALIDLYSKLKGADDERN